MKRLVATSLWFTVGWFVGSVSAFVMGVGPALGPILAIAAAGIVFVDPRQVFWASSTRSMGAQRT